MLRVHDRRFLRREPEELGVEVVDALERARRPARSRVDAAARAGTPAASSSSSESSRTLSTPSRRLRQNCVGVAARRAGAPRCRRWRCRCRQLPVVRRSRGRARRDGGVASRRRAARSRLACEPPPTVSGRQGSGEAADRREAVQVGERDRPVELVLAAGGACARRAASGHRCRRSCRRRRCRRCPSVSSQTASTSRSRSLPASTGAAAARPPRRAPRRATAARCGRSCRWACGAGRRAPTMWPGTMTSGSVPRRWSLTAAGSIVGAVGVADT